MTGWIAAELACRKSQVFGDSRAAVRSASNTAQLQDVQAHVK
jgi:hypothetical protein